jgi:hypothetical protein
MFYLKVIVNGYFKKGDYMSKGPTRTGKEDIRYKTYYHLKLEPKDWCDYFKGVCDIKNNIGEKYCWACKYRKPLDIPHLLAERGSK